MIRYRVCLGWTRCCTLLPPLRPWTSSTSLPRPTPPAQSPHSSRLDSLLGLSRLDPLLHPATPPVSLDVKYFAVVAAFSGVWTHRDIVFLYTRCVAFYSCIGIWLIYMLPPLPLCVREHQVPCHHRRLLCSCHCLVEEPSLSRGPLLLSMLCSFFLFLFQTVRVFFTLATASDLSAPGSAVAVERIFSGGRDTISLRRASLQPHTIRTLMLIKQQLRLKRS